MCQLRGRTLNGGFACNDSTIINTFVNSATDSTRCKKMFLAYLANGLHGWWHTHFLEFYCVSIQILHFEFRHFIERAILSVYCKNVRNVLEFRELGLVTFGTIKCIFSNFRGSLSDYH